VHQAAVAFLCHRLHRLEQELAGCRGSGGTETPDDLPELMIGVIAAKRAAGVGGQVEVGVPFKALGLQRRHPDPVDPVMLHAPVAASLTRDQIPTGA
jgi:hypothetical protein